LHTADIAIVGGGISGTLAATILGRAGYDVCLIDRHAVYPPDFRAEHLDGPQVAQLGRLDLLPDLVFDLYQGQTVTLARSGRIVGTAGSINYGLPYEALVNRARASLPDNAWAVTGRVVQIETSDSMQRIAMSDGRIVTCRLVILATGPGYILGRQLGITREVIRHAHSLTFGFDIEPVDDVPFAHSFLVYQRENIRDRIDYLSAFTMGATTRVNLFTYRDYRDPWTAALLANPKPAIAQALPGFAAVGGDFRVVGPVVARPVDLYVSKGYRREGVVMIGDAFQSACPATGMGLARLLTDIEQLTTRHVPRWLATPGMQAAKIAAFYDDPVKQACDRRALHDSEYRRSLSTETTLGWQLHRLRVRTMETMKGWRRPPALAAQPLAGPAPQAARQLPAPPTETGICRLEPTAPGISES
jgi:2-polyprenyl-6-methoxyphenol hydroxylase-like FAD-dependent oxidoreductase